MVRKYRELSAAAVMAAKCIFDISACLNLQAKEGCSCKFPGLIVPCIKFILCKMYVQEQLYEQTYVHNHQDYREHF